MNQTWLGRLLLLAVISFPAFAQLTAEQKALDLQTIASLYAKQYAPYEWKRDNLGFDLFDLRPWLDRARASKTDVEYLDIVAEYVAKLNDIHSYYTVNSDFEAYLGIGADIFDGKVLIETIDRSYLPARQFDFAIGDEIVQFNGKPINDELADMARINAFANPRSTVRWAADQLGDRLQAYFPRVVELGASATILVRKADGTDKSYTIPWDKSGTELRKLGPLPNLILNGRDRGARQDTAPLPSEVEVPGVPAFRKPWVRLQSNFARKNLHLRGFGARAPIYTLPANFVLRLGRSRSDFFYSGTYASGGKRVGYIRISDFQPVSFSQLNLPLNQFAQEIGFLKANTDVLVVDITRNPGGYGCYAEALLQLLIPKRFVTFGGEIRPTLDLVAEFRSAVEDSSVFGQAWETALYGQLYKAVQSAYAENRGRTGTVPFCGPSLDVEPTRDRTGALLAYNKPVLLLTDEFTTSGGDLFAAVMQDNQAATLFGYRTAGAGGSTNTVPAGFYSEGATNVTGSMLIRPTMKKFPGFPASNYIENVGVAPDVEYDYQTRANLMNNGRDFVDAFTKAALALVGGGN